MKILRFLILCLGLGLFLPPTMVAAKTVSVTSAAGITVQFNDSSGRYEIRTQRPDWKYAGTLGKSARNVIAESGADRLGAFQEVRFDWQAGIPLTGSIRVYDSRPVALFVVELGQAAEEMPVVFPRFTSFPAGLHHFSYKNEVFAPPSFKLETNGTPWLLFDDRALAPWSSRQKQQSYPEGAYSTGQAVVISPADHFMIACMTGDGAHDIAGGLNPQVRHLPAHFKAATLMAFGQGINATWDTWGGALTEWIGRHRPANDVDTGLRYLGYWTDNGAVYYYNYEPSLGYAGTLEALVQRYAGQQIPIRYLQLDSWWYSKTLTDPDGRSGRPKNSRLPEGEWNRYGGLLKYEAHPALFSNGLAAFQKRIGLPLITHNRWIDPASPYRQQYRVSGFAGMDPAWWQTIMNYIADSGVTCYEQDWLNVIYNHSPELSSTVDAGDQFAGGMARAAQARGMSLQYCMALPRLFLQGARYDNLTTIRVSEDRFQRSRWDAFLYTSRFAGALGIWPWTDVFMSTETNNLLLANLSAGMVGVGDAIGSGNRENLLCVARPDGVLVKPDEPILPSDETYIGDARGLKLPMVAWTHSDHSTMRTAYVFAYSRNDATNETGFTPAAMGFQGDVCVLNWRSGTAQYQSARQRFAFRLEPGATAYFVVVPSGPSGLAFFGDAGKYVSNGRQRIAALDKTPGGLTVTVTFAAGEKSVHLFGNASRAPTITAQCGSVGAAGYHAASGRFSVEVFPAAPVIPGRDPTQTAVVEITSQ